MMLLNISVFSILIPLGVGSRGRFRGLEVSRNSMIVGLGTVQSAVPGWIS